MAAPVLIGVAALTVGWIALSKERAAMAAPPTTAGAPVSVGLGGIRHAGAQPSAVAIGDNGMAGVTAPCITAQPTIEGSLATTGGSVTDTPPSTGGQDPSTQPSAPAVEPQVAPSAQTPSGGESTDDGGAKVIAYNPSLATTTKYLDVASVYYGNKNGVTRAQESQALEEIGPLAGMVW